ncbi:MAG: hypothetical protein ACTSQH_02300 [Candidatus Hodarchaeales archaeon]
MSGPPDGVIVEVDSYLISLLMIDTLVHALAYDIDLYTESSSHSQRIPVVQCM